MTLLLGVLVALAPSAQAVTLPQGFSQSTYASGLGRVTAMAFAPDGRLFVIEQDGAVRVVRDGKVLERPFLTLDVDARGERGLTGIALDPGFATNGYVYLYYTVPGSPAHNRVSRFIANGDVARRSGGALDERRVLDLEPLSSALIHNGGAMSFGPDRKLYVAVGENANGAKAQSLSSRFGKVLRINADGSIPGDNPFIGRGATGDNRAIWAMGLRNPFTFGFSRGGRLHINDVGQSKWEEINRGIAGANYGWPATEGPTQDERFDSPLYAYSHEDGEVTGCAITGGTFYDPSTSRYPSDYVGDYFFADFCGHWIKRLDLSTGKVTGFATAASQHPVDLKVGPDGTLYYLSRGERSVVRVSYSSSKAPTITQQPADVTASTGETVTFTAAAAGAAPLRYQWQRNGRAVEGATSATYRLSSVDETDNGETFRVVVSNASGSVTSRSATLTITDDRPPRATITSPAPDTTYSGGDVIKFSGTGNDPETGALPASAFTWQVDFHHAEHSHPFVAPFSGTRSGSFDVPRTGHVDSNVWYRIRLTVEDASGRKVETTRDVDPRTVGLTVATAPAGLRLELDDQPRTAPHVEQAVVGLRRKLSAPTTQSRSGVLYRFVSWSDGGAASHEITVPPSATTYTAVYRAGTTDVPGTKRLAGADRYATAAAVSRDTFPAGSVPVAFVVTGAAHADALTGGPAADRLVGPVLPVTRSAVPRPVRDELTRLRPGRIVVLGGPNAVGDA
ncbi:MAG: PQQ-dependent sugar dehydrogenase, partial [Actinomycetota bacterium]|nr:PQQ-dependent sugar dehydrogenase [Actinomycetota bacterium]